MINGNVLKNKLFIFITCALFLVVSSYALFLVYSNLSLADTDADKWDGITVSDYFEGGNGSADNPYLISKASDFILFKTLIESDGYEAYNDKYYKLTSDIDLDNHPIDSIGDTDKVFKGNFNGDSYTIKNININEGQVIEDKTYYGLFGYVTDSSIYNVNIDSINIEVKGKNENDENINNVIVGSLIGSTSVIDTEEENYIKNISISNGKINILNLNEDNSNYINGFTNYIYSGLNIKNIFVDINYNKNYDTNIYNFSNKIDGDVTNVIINNNLFKDYNELNGTVNNLVYSNGIEIDSILDDFNSEINEDFYFDYVDNKFVFVRPVYFETNELVNNQAFTFSINQAIVTHDSGIDGNTVYVNDLTNDYQYFMGKNYSESTSGSFASGNNTNKYNDGNLVKVQINYSGCDFNHPTDNNYCGAVSSTEAQNRFVTYHYYYKEGNARNLKIELIDNPFQKRPNGKGFNGWVTDYEGATIYYDSTYYKRYLILPLGGEMEYNVTLYTSWINANIQTGNNNNLADLDNAGMKNYPLRTRMVDGMVEQVGGFKAGVTYYERIQVDRYTTFNANNSVTTQAYYTGNSSSGAIVDTALTERTGSYIYRNNNLNAKVTVYYVTNDATRDFNKTYYKVVNNNASVMTNADYDTVLVPGQVQETIGIDLDETDSAIGLFYKKNINGLNSEYYNNLGQNCSVVSCGANNTYKLLDSDDDEAINHRNYNTGNYYYLVTRDTNILQYTGVASNIVYFGVNKPYTLTGYNGTRITADNIVAGNLDVGNDLVIEDINIANGNGNYINFNKHNVKIGRNVNINGYTVYGSNSNGSYYSEMIMESGTYPYVYAQNGGAATSNGKVILGSDYDRVSNVNNKFTITNVFAGSNDGSTYSNGNTGTNLEVLVKSGRYGTGYGTISNNNVNGIRTGPSSTMNLVNKTAQNNYQSLGIFLGSNATNTSNAFRTLVVQGGSIFNLYGGYLGNNNASNPISISMTGGYAMSVFGGTDVNVTNGNRTVAITGGNISNAVAGGSNGYTCTTGNSNCGSLVGKTLTYIGGTANIGGTTGAFNNNIIGNWYRIDRVGTVLGGGLGNTRNHDNTASVQSSHVVINGGTIQGNVFGGGNFGAVGKMQNPANPYIILDILGGTINNEVFGGSNNNTFGYYAQGSNSWGGNGANLTVNLKGGTINNNVYGCSNGWDYVKETWFSSTATITVNVSDNIRVNGNVFAGGSGSHSYIFGNTNINMTGGYIKGDLFGGSAMGDVNCHSNGGSCYNADVASTQTYKYKTRVLVSGGTVDGNVYGGGMGDTTYKDNVQYNGGGYETDFASSRGAVEVEITGGTIIQSVFVGNKNRGDLSGALAGSGQGADNTAHVRNGTSSMHMYVSVSGNANIGNVFGAGDGAQTYALETLVQVSGGTIGSVYGGSNQGEAVDSLVNISGGNIGSVFGGSRLAKFHNIHDNNTYDSNTPYTARNGYKNRALKTEVNISGGTFTDINGGIYGSGEGDANNDASVGTTTVNITGGRFIHSSTDQNVGVSVYGGGKSSSVDNTATVNVNNNVSASSLVNDANGYCGAPTNVYGGSNVKGTVKNSVVNVSNNAGVVNSIFGGGNATSVTATSNSTTINFNGYAKNIFGGSNSTGNVPESVINIESGTVENVYGGNNAGGTTTTTNITLNNGTITNVFGGGNAAQSVTSNIDMFGGSAENIYGGGNAAGLTTSNVTIYEGTATNVYGGSNSSGDVTTSNVLIGEDIPPEEPDVDEHLDNPLTVTVTKNTVASTGAIRNQYYASGTVTVTMKNNTPYPITEWTVNVNMPTDTTVKSGTTYNATDGLYVITQDTNNKRTLSAGETYTITLNIRTGPRNSGGTTSANFFANGSLQNVVVDVPVVEVPHNDGSNIHVTNVYGGNNINGVTSNTNVTVLVGNISDVYGGGNLAAVGRTNVVVKKATIENIYGGGNQAAVTGNTHLDLDDSILATNVYGGGNEGTVGGNTDVYATNCKINGSLFAGGNGTSALVYGNTTVNVDGDTVIGTPTSVAPHAGCLYGSGNAASTGTNDSHGIATVNLVGGHVYGNVYGGANTSIVYGGTQTNIGNAVSTVNGLVKSNIEIDGTVFGGGESNASGSENYDFTFKSVYGDIKVNIDGTGYVDNNLDFLLKGSIFGSGNASENQGTSEIYVKKLGLVNSPSRNLSFQRTNLLTIDNSCIELIGLVDRTNKWDSILYSFNRIDKLIIKNNTTLLLQKNANLLMELYSGVDVNNNLVDATVTINDDNKTVTRNVDNRIYMLNGSYLNVTRNEEATSYGKVTGMTFFGLYNSFGSGNYSFGMYGNSYDYGDSADSSAQLLGGSYVLGRHELNHDITKDGFYTNSIEDGEILTAYIDPTPENTGYYYWKIGIVPEVHKINLISTKFSSLGTKTLVLNNEVYSRGDVKFDVIGFNSEGLAEGVSLVAPNSVPRVADTPQQANQILGLSMKTESREWTSYGTTSFISNSADNILGDFNYLTDSQKVSPAFMFYLYHAKNVEDEAPLGTVTVNIQAAVPINPIEYDLHYISVEISLQALLDVEEDSYDASITYGKKYDMPAKTDVRITNKSQFTAYYSLFAEVDSFADFYGRNNDYRHALVSNYALPVGTQITMIDYSLGYDQPKYYLYTVDQNKYNATLSEMNTDNESTYFLSDFIRMGSTSTNNKYNDATANQSYYSNRTSSVSEEFIFIFDFKDTNVSGNSVNNSILFELRNNDNRAVVSVYGMKQPQMVYSLYDESNVVLQETVSGLSDYLYNGEVSNFTFETAVGYQLTDNLDAIIDTNYESSSMGLNVYFYDNSGTQVSSSLLQGTVLKINNDSYFADADGVIRIKLAGKVSNLLKNMSLVLDRTLPSGVYNVKFVLFSSPDGLHNSSLEKSTTYTKQITVVNSDSALLVTTKDENKVINGETGLNADGTNTATYTITNSSNLSNPSIRVALFKRDIDSSESVTYEEVDFNSIFSHELTSSENSSSRYELLLDSLINDSSDITFTYKDETIRSGTYKLVFRLCDNNHIVDEEVQYIIVSKSVEND